MKKYWRTWAMQCNAFVHNQQSFFTFSLFIVDLSEGNFKNHLYQKTTFNHSIKNLWHFVLQWKLRTNEAENSWKFKNSQPQHQISRLIQKKFSFRSGAYLGGGGHCAMAPPFGSLGLQNCIVKWAKLRHGPLLCKLGIRLLAGNLSEFEWKMGRTLSKDLFFFFFLEITWFWAEKSFEFRISAEKSPWILAKTFFFFFFGDHLILGRKKLWISDFGRKITLNFGEDLFFFFSGDHLILGRKKLWISDFGRKITLNFGEDLFFFFFGDHLILGGKKLWISELSKTFKINENSSQGRLHTSHSFKIAPLFRNPAYATASDECTWFDEV